MAFGEIWISGRTSDTAYTMLKLYPNEFWIELDVPRALSKQKRSHTFLMFEQRGKSMEVRDLGQIYLPLP